MNPEQSGSAPWRVGVLFSQSGVTAAIEKTQLNGTLLAIQEINESGGVHGREIEPVVYDPAASPDSFRELAGQLLNEDGVNVMFGCYMSSTRKAVLKVIEERNGLLFYPTLYEGFEFSNNVIYTGAAPNQNSVQLADFMMNRYGNRVYLIGSNYVYPYESNRIMADLVRQNHGSVIDEKYLPLDAEEKDFVPIVSEIKKQQPDFVFSTVVGISTAHFYNAYADAGLDPAKMPIASLTTNEAEIMEMGVDVACGHITSAPYFTTVEGEKNQRFVANYRKAFGKDSPIASVSESAYFQVHVMAQALERTGTLDTDVLRQAVLGSEFDAPQGLIRIDPENNHTYLWPRIGRVNADGQFDIVGQAMAAVRPDPYLVAPQKNDWGMQQLRLDGPEYARAR